MASGRRPRVNLKLIGERQIHALLYPEANAIQAERPRTRGDCKDGIRPCPWVGCRHHLYLTVNEQTGAMTMNFPRKAVWDMDPSCSLDVADANPDGLLLSEMGALTDLTKERIRQIEEAAKGQLQGFATDLGREFGRPPPEWTPPPGPAPPDPATTRAPAPASAPRTIWRSPPIPARAAPVQLTLWDLGARERLRRHPHVSRVLQPAPQLPLWREPAASAGPPAEFMTAGSGGIW